MATRIAGIQPGYLPWLGYFDQMLHVDAFLLADEMEFSSGGWAHRNRVRGPDGPQWLTLPVRPRRGEAICDVVLEPGGAWARKHLTTLRHLYARSAPAAPLLARFEQALDPDASRLIDASIPALRSMAECLRIETPLLISSELGLEAKYRARFPDMPGPTHRIVAYMEALGASELLEGETGRAYFDVPLFESHGMKVHFQHYAHPVWPQRHEPFVSHLSAIDLLLCVGEEEAARILRSGTGGAR
ncbi:MAG: WbqC family protein [Myxococcales bacterium]|nr:WbqC family protein [Myxococcales bacterium]